MKLSAEFQVSASLALLLLLIEPSSPSWRIAILVIACALLISAIRSSNWVTGRREILTLDLITFKGERNFKDERSLVALLSPYVVVITFVAVFGVVTWPHRVRALTGSDSLSAVISTNALPWPTPTQKGILHPTATTAAQRGTGPTTPTNPPEELITVRPQPPTNLKITVQ
jgi:hypothetical protein